MKRTGVILWVAISCLGSVGGSRPAPAAQDEPAAAEKEAEAPVLDDETRQRQTVADLRSLGTALMSWLVDQVGAASAGADKTYSFDGFELRTHKDVVTMLQPSETFYYMKDVPEFDGWGHPLEVWLSDNLLDSRVVLIRSPGADGKFSNGVTPGYTIQAFPASEFGEDIVWADGFFIRWPEAKRK